MKKITILLMMLAVTLSISAQENFQELIADLMKRYPKTPSREIIYQDPATGQIQRHVTEYSFRGVKPKKTVSFIGAMCDAQNGDVIIGEVKNDGSVYEIRVADSVPDYRTIYILRTRCADISKCKDFDLHVIYGKMTSDEMSTNFSYNLNKYYTLVNKCTGAKLGVSFDYNCHASTYKETAPSGKGPNGMIIDDNKVFRFKFVPTTVVDTRISNEVCEDCFIVTEDLFALEDGSETEEGRWLVFRYINKNNPCQQWKLVEKNGVVTIINKATGRCVDLAGGDTKEGAAVFSYEYNDDPQSNSNQKWVIEEAK